MKKIYICPMTTTIMAETCCICAGYSQWAVYKPQDPESPEEPEKPSSWGDIWDEKGPFNEDKDPFDPDNW